MSTSFANHLVASVLLVLSIALIGITATSATLLSINQLPSLRIDDGSTNSCNFVREEDKHRCGCPTFVGSSDVDNLHAEQSAPSKNRTVLIARWNNLSPNDCSLATIALVRPFLCAVIGVETACALVAIAQLWMAAFYLVLVSKTPILTQSAPINLQISSSREATWNSENDRNAVLETHLRRQRNYNVYSTTANCLESSRQAPSAMATFELERRRGVGDAAATSPKWPRSLRFRRRPLSAGRGDERRPEIQHRGGALDLLPVEPLHRLTSAGSGNAAQHLPDVPHSRCPTSRDERSTTWLPVQPYARSTHTTLPGEPLRRTRSLCEADLRGTRSRQQRSFQQQQVPQQSCNSGSAWPPSQRWPTIGPPPAYSSISVSSTATIPVTIHMPADLFAPSVGSVERCAQPEADLRQLCTSPSPSSPPLPPPPPPYAGQTVTISSTSSAEHPVEGSSVAEGSAENAETEPSTSNFVTVI